MTFDTWWNNHGSLHNDIFNMSAEAREIFKTISKSAWDENERIALADQQELEDQINYLEGEVSELKEALDDAKQDHRDALDDIETLKDSIRACL